LARDRVVKQIGLPDELAYKLKMYALQRRSDVQEITDEAVEEMCLERDELKTKEGRPPDYFASPTNTTPFNIRLAKRLAARVAKAAKEDGGTLRRILYTAMVLYVRRRKL
jgi:hypothetical protein